MHTASRNNRHDRTRRMHESLNHVCEAQLSNCNSLPKLAGRMHSVLCKRMHLPRPLLVLPIVLP